VRIFSLFAALVAAVVVVGASGAVTAKERGVAKVDVSTRSAVIHYLRSIHVNPHRVVIQRGARNYAGPNCPGKGWRCAATRRTVVQIAKPGGRNRFVCRSTRCVVVQLALGTRARPRTTRGFLAAPAAKGNSGVCIKTTGATQSCVINQSSSSGDNTAVVYEDVGKTTGLTQTLLFTASITQKATGSSNKNVACVHQKTNAEGNTVAGQKKGVPVAVNLESHQSIAITQDSAHGGNQAQQSATSAGVCTGSSLEQTQSLASLANGSGQITQNENALSNGPNMTLDVKQNQGAGFFGTANGLNFAIFTQTNTLTAIANTAVGPVAQTQSSVDTGNGDGGILASVNQDSRDKSTADATQTETQCEDAATGGLTTCEQDADFNGSYALTQTQHGPASVTKASPKRGGRHVYSVKKGGCCSVQTGNPADTFVITQSSTQFNDTGQHQTNTIQGDCKTDGTCTASQTAAIDGSTTTQSQTGTDLNVQTTCVGPTCFSENGAQLTATNTDIAEFGYGGMRVNTSNSGTPGTGTGSISIPANSINGTVTRALLYWNGPTSSSDPNSNAAVSFGGSPITGTNIGSAASNCWNVPADGVAYTNSQSYRSDVTDLVKGGLVSGGGTFALADFTKTDGMNVVSDINGVSLVVFSYDGQSADYRNVVLWSGNDSNEASTGDPAGWDETLTGVPWPGGTGGATLDFVVGDGQSFADGAISVNGTEIVPAGNIFEGDSTPAGPGNFLGDLWDLKSFAIPASLLTTGSNSLQVTSPLAGDCLSLVVAAANMPTTAQTLAPATAPLPAASAATGAAIAGAPGGR
jgi:hypothetical protein